MSQILNWSAVNNFATGHRAGCRQIIGIKRCKALATVSTFGYSEKIDAVGIHTSIGKKLTQQTLPNILFTLLIPSVMLFAGDLWNKIERWRIVEAFAKFVSYCKFAIFWAGTVQIENEGPSVFGALAFGAEIERHYSVVLLYMWQMPT